MRRIFLYIFCFLTIPAVAQRDTARLLPAFEVVSTQLLQHSKGQYYKVLDSSDLVAFQLRSLADVLTQHTALDLRSYGNASAILSTRGGGSAHTAVVWNGINLQNSLSGVADLTILPVSGMANIGFKMGGESALFGGGAVSGVVFFDNEIHKKSGFHGSIAGLKGSFGDFRQQVQCSVGNGRVATQISATHQAADNDFYYRNTAQVGNPRYRQVNNQQRGANVLHSVFAQISPRTTLRTHLWYQQSNRQIAPIMTAANTAARQADVNWRGVAELTQQAGTGVAHARFAYIDDLLVYESNLVAESRNHAKNYIAELDYEGVASSRWTYRVGANWTQNNALSNNFSETRQRNRFALFSAQTYSLRRTRINWNIRQEVADGRFVPLTSSLGFEQVVSRLSGLFWSKNALKLRGSAARNYNLPALNDLYWNQLGNPDLRPESSWSGEGGFDIASLPDKTSGRQTALHLTLYAMRIRDRIQWSPGNDGIWRPSNLFYSTSRGIEMATSAQKQWKHLRMDTRLSYQYTRAQNADGFQLLYVPKHTAQATVGLQYRSTRLQWRQSWNSKRPMSADNSVHTKAFGLSNLEAQWSPSIAKTRLSLTATVQNVFNTNYQVIQYYAMPGRNFLVQVGLAF